MSLAARACAVRTTSWALLLTAGLLLPMTVTSTAYLTLLVLLCSGVALVAAVQVRQDDVLGWLTAVGAAMPAAALVWAARTSWLPGHRTGSWDVPGVGTLALSAVVVLLALACTLLPAPVGRNRSAGTLRP